MPRRILDRKDIATVEAKRILEKFNPDELGEFQRRTLDYATKFSKLPPAKAERLLKELTDKFKLDQAQSIEVVNCMPESKEELRAILATKGKIITSEQLEEVLKAISHAAGSK
jgi:DNA-directed RNA polymerase subunit F